MTDVVASGENRSELTTPAEGAESERGRFARAWSWLKIVTGIEVPDPLKDVPYASSLPRWAKEQLQLEDHRIPYWRRKEIQRILVLKQTTQVMWIDDMDKRLDTLRLRGYVGAVLDASNPYVENPPAPPELTDEMVAIIQRLSIDTPGQPTKSSRS